MLVDSVLPNELLTAIFQYLDLQVLASVARVSRRFNGVAEYILYSLVVITDDFVNPQHLPHRTIRWCQSMHSRAHLTLSVRRLQIRWCVEHGTSPSPLLLAVCNQLSYTLSLLLELEYLELFLGPANFVSVPHENLHVIERVLRHSVLPALRFCSLGAEYTKGTQPYTSHLTAFLSHTPALRHLKLSAHYSSLNLPSATHVLSSLQTFRGSAAAAASLLPGRPVHSLALIGQDSDVSQENLLRMTYTSTPLRSLDLSAIAARVVLLRNISVYLPTLERLRVRLALRHTLHYAFSGIRLLTGLSSVLSAFQNLVYLDLSPTESGRANPSDENALCIEWRRACPLLKTVVFPSQAEWVLDGESGWHMIVS